MSENIELKCFVTRVVSNDNAIEEYQEIEQNSTSTESDTKIFPHVRTKQSAEDFFIQRDVNINEKGARAAAKKKKSKMKKKTIKQSTIMDVISTEIASSASPIVENVLTIIKPSDKEASSFLQDCRPRHIFRPCGFDTETGYSNRRTNTNANLRPIFPNVLDQISVTNNDIHVSYVQPSKITDARPDNEANTRYAKFLDIEIRNIKFIHHHDFTVEQLMDVKLVEYYNRYTTNKSVFNNILRDIKINRIATYNLKEELIKVKSYKTEDIRFDQTLRKYISKQIELKNKYFEINKNQKELIHKLISIWSDIEMIREKMGQTLTNHTLVITNDSVSNEDYERRREETFQIEFSDMLDKLEYDYVSQYIEYKEAKTRKGLDNHKNATKPKLKIDEDTLKEQVETIVNDTVVKNKFDFILRDDNLTSDITPKKKHYYYFEVYVDDVFVCTSERYLQKTNSIFDITFTEAFSVQILQNNILTLVLFEDGKEFSFVKYSLYEIHASFNAARFNAVLFENNNKVEPTLNRVGSGYSIKEIVTPNKLRLKSTSTFQGKLYSTCEVNLKMGWNEKISENNSEKIKLSFDIERQLNRLIHGIDKPNIELIINVISEVYEKDVRGNDDVVNSLINLCNTDSEINDDNFTVDVNSPEFLRLKLLHLRDKGNLAGLENQTVPLFASQITTEQLNCLQKCDANGLELQYLSNKENEMDPIELQRFIGIKYVQKLNKNMLRNVNEHLLKETQKDVVREFQNLTLRAIFSSESKLSSMSNSIKQKFLRESLGKEQDIIVSVYRAFNLQDRSTTVLSDESEGDEEKIAGYKVRPLRPFVKVSYRSESIQTATAIGCHPTWNQTVKIKAKPEPLTSICLNIYDECKVNVSDVYSEEEHSAQSKTVHYRYYNKWLGSLQVPLHAVLTLGMVRGTFKITTPPILFGYENVSQSKDTHSLIPEIKQLMKKDTSFISLQISTNLLNFGGIQGYHQPVPSYRDDDYLIKYLNNFLTDYINDFPMRNISLTFIDSSGNNKCITQFLQPIPLPDATCFPRNPKGRAESALSKSSVLSKSSSSRSSGRNNEAENNSAVEERESIYSTHDWRSAENQLTKMINACLRYVSLIPTYEVVESHVVTLLGLELLKVLHGSPLDHTILLASYFLYLGVKSWVVIGLGLPRGLSSYVLTKYDLKSRRLVMLNEEPLRSRGFLVKSEGCVWNIYDAVSGERFELRDIACPLKTVDYVFDNENIWVNVQTSLECENVSFDFTRSSDWQLVFDKATFVMRLPIAPEIGLYSNPPEVERLRQMIETKLKEKVQKWRSHMKTIWNRYCSTLLREILPHWEYWTFNPSEQKPGFSHRLKQIMATYKIFGFPLNIPYVNTKSLLSTVKATCIHVNNDPNVEFGLGVEVFAYPNNVLSVWVFLTTITRI